MGLNVWDPQGSARTRTNQSEQVSTPAMVISSVMSMGLELGELEAGAAILTGTKLFFSIGVCQK